MKRLIFPALALVAMVGCRPPTMTPEQQSAACGPRPTMDQAGDAVSQYVRDSGLKDPFSAQTKGVSILGMGGIQNGILRGGEWKFGWVVAFQLNAKNSFGAYVGWQPRYMIINSGGVWWMNSISDMPPSAPTML